jgi:ligand-binding sensor domain-containing protein
MLFLYIIKIWTKVVMCMTGIFKRTFHAEYSPSRSNIRLHTYVVKRAFLMLAGLIQLQIVLFSQSAGFTSIRIPIEDFSANHSIRCVYQDHIGLLWMGTRNGLYVYDGSRAEQIDFKCPKLINQEVFSIAEDDQDRLWVCTNSGPIVLNATRSAIIPHQNLEISSMLLNYPNFSVCQGQNQSLIILAGENIYEYARLKLKQINRVPPQSITTSGVKLFYLTKSQSLVINSRLQRTIFLLTKKGEFSIIQKDIPIVLSQTDNNTIYGVRNSPDFKYSLWEYDHNKKNFFNLKKDQHHKVGQLIQTIKNRNDVNHRIVDTWGIFPLKWNLWAVSCTEGLFLVYPNVEVFDQINVTQQHRIRAITTDRYGHLIYGSHEGLYWYDKHSHKHQRIIPHTSTIWRILALDKNNDWFIACGEGWQNKLFFLRATPNGVFLDKTRVLKNTYSECNHLIQDNKGRGFWFSEGSENKFYINFLSNNLDSVFQLPSEIQVTGIKCIAQTDYLWIASNNGLHRATIKFTGSVPSLQMDNRDIPPALQHTPINTLLTDRLGNLWIGTTSHGLFYYQPTLHACTQYTQKDGLADNTVFSITEAPDNILWIGTGKGLSRYDIKKNRFQNYYKDAGLLSEEFNTAATYIASDGTVFLGGQNGINFFRPDNFQTDTSVYDQFLMVNMSKGIDRFNNNKIFARHESTINIAPEDRLIEISFRTTNLIGNAKTHFRYRLSDLDQDWHYINYTDKAVFTNLPVGTHTLEVQSQSHKGIWDASATYYLSVMPPWYKTWWFRVLLALVILAALYSFYQFHLRQLRREFNLRNQITHDLHDDLGSRIYLLRTLSHQITNPINTEADKKKYLTHFEAISSETFKSIRDFIWAFDPKQDEVKQLFDRMDDFAENYLSPLVADIVIQRTYPEEHLKIGPRLKHHLIYIYQELLTNIIKHTDSKAINITLSVNNKEIEISIHNQHNGCKNDPANQESTHKIGKKNIQHRLDEIGGTLEWIDQNDNQQMIILKVKN